MASFRKRLSSQTCGKIGQAQRKALQLAADGRFGKWSIAKKVANLEGTANGSSYDYQYEFHLLWDISF